MRKEFKGNAVRTSLTSAASAAATTFQIANNSGWPTGSVGPFAAILTRTSDGAQEKVLFTSRSGTTLSGATRGHDGTVALAFDAGDTIQHVVDAETIDEANSYANTGHVPLAGGTMTGSLTTSGSVTANGANLSIAEVNFSSAHTSYPTGLSYMQGNAGAGWPDTVLVVTFNYGNGWRTKQVVHGIDTGSGDADPNGDIVWVRNWNVTTQQWTELRRVGGFVGTYATKNANQTITPSTNTDIVWETIEEQYPPGGWSGDLKTYTIQRAGVYQLRATVQATPVAAGKYMLLRIYVNGSVIQDFRAPNANSNNSLIVAATKRLSVGDTVKFVVWHDDAANETLQGTLQQYSEASIVRVAT